MSRAVAYMGPHPRVARRHRLSPLAKALCPDDGLHLAWVSSSCGVDVLRWPLAFDGQSAEWVEHLLFHLDLLDAGPVRGHSTMEDGIERPM